jgi:hypothetical protein
MSGNSYHVAASAVVVGSLALGPAALASGPYGLVYNSSSYPDGNDHLYQVNLSTGELTDLGFIGADYIEAIDILPDGTIIGMDGYTDNVWELNDPPGRLIGQTGFRYGVDAAVSYHPHRDTLYNLNGAETFDITHTWIYEINPETGHATYLAQNANIYVNSLAISDDGVAYAADNVFTDNFYSVDLATGAMTFIGHMETLFPSGFHMDFDCRGTLWATTSLSNDSHDVIYTIDTETGRATYVATMEYGSAGFNGFAVLPHSSCTCPADLNEDGEVGVNDFLALLSAWGASGVPEDIDGDGTVGITDFLELLAAWGACA